MMSTFMANFVIGALIILCIVTKCSNIIFGCRSRYNCGHKLNMVTDVSILILSLVMFLVAASSFSTMQYTPYKACAGRYRTEKFTLE